MRATRILCLLLICQIVIAIAPIRALWALAAGNLDRAWEVVKAYDRLGNVIANGDGHETLSSRANRGRAEGSRWACVLCRLLDRIEKDHCEKSSGV